MQIVPFTENLIEQVTAFTDTNIGLNYYTLSEMATQQKKSVTSTGEITSFVLIDDKNKICGLRLAFPPGNWAHGKGSKLRPELWPFKLHEAAYFQSLFVSDEAQGLGFGPQLSEKSIQIFKKLNAKGIVTHCWKESPNNSSFRYLEKFNFTTVIEHPEYWIDIDYTCTRDGNPCRCTALEMIKVL
jgi:ribosomal protein S18 acetylase RimI-like enzyme